MAMTKKEQVAFDAMKKELAVARAFHRTQPVLPDVPPPSLMGGVDATRGFLAYVRSLCRPGVELMWSTTTAHGTGSHANSRGSGSQNARWLHSTPERALRALRYETEERMAKELADIDTAIGNCKEKP